MIIKNMKMWWLEVAKAATFASINPISFKSTRSDRIWWMKLWLKHLLVPYMPPYQGDLAELTGSFWPFMTFVGFIWPFRFGSFTRTKIWSSTKFWSLVPNFHPGLNSIQQGSKFWYQNSIRSKFWYLDKNEMKQAAETESSVAYSYKVIIALVW